MGYMTEKPFELGLLALLRPRRGRLCTVFTLRKHVGSLRRKPRSALVLRQKRGEGRSPLRLLPVRTTGPFEVRLHSGVGSPQVRMAAAAEPGFAKVCHVVSGVHPSLRRHSMLPTHTWVRLQAGKHVWRVNLTHNEATHPTLNKHVDAVFGGNLPLVAPGIGANHFFKAHPQPHASGSSAAAAAA